MITIYLSEDIDLDEADLIKANIENILGTMGYMVDRIEVNQ